MITLALPLAVPEDIGLSSARLARLGTVIAGEIERDRAGLLEAADPDHGSEHPDLFLAGEAHINRGMARLGADTAGGEVMP